MFSEYVEKLYDKVASISFETLLWIIWGAFAAVFIATLFLSLCLPRIRAASKRPFFNLMNAFAALTLAAFLTEHGLPQSLLASVIFWCAGYLMYGVLCLITKNKKNVIQSQVAISALPAAAPAKQPPVRAEVPAAKSTVRLEHAISVTDRLLQKNLGKGDRQELEKLKNTLAVLQMKGALTPSESDILNDNFNALLKLMAKYNV